MPSAPPGPLAQLGLDCLFLALEFLELDDVLAVYECSRHFAKSLAVGAPNSGIWAKLRPDNVSAAVCAQPTARRARLVCAAYRPVLKYHELAKILTKACTADDLDLARWGARLLNFRIDSTHLTSLMFCTCEAGHVRMAEWLVATFNVGRNTAGSVLILFRDACKGGRLAVAAWLRAAFELTPRDARAADNYALRHACAGGHLSVVGWLVDTFGLDAADAAARDSAAFKAACRNGRLVVARWLAQRFGSTRAVAASALAEACRAGRLDVAEWLTQQAPACRRDQPAGSVACALRRACRRNRAPFVKWLLASFTVAAEDRHRAAVVACAHCPNTAIIHRLLKRSRRPMAMARLLELLLAACAGGRVELYSWLVVQYGQPVLDPTWAGRLLLMAAQHGRLPMVEWLSERYAALIPDVAAVVLLSASQRGHDMVANWAVTRATPVDPQLGLTAFIVACANGRLSVAQRLARHFEFTAADIVANNSNAAMRAAAAGNHFTVMDWLSDTYGIEHVHDDMGYGAIYSLPIAVDPHSRCYADSSDDEPGGDTDSIIGDDADEPTEDGPGVEVLAQPNVAYATIGRTADDFPEPPEDAEGTSTVEYGQSVLNILDI